MSDQSARTSRHSDPLRELYGAKALVVASTGGHLSQAVRWADRLGLEPDSLFVTFDSPQSHSLLASRRIRFVPYVAPRDWRGILRLTRELRSLTSEEAFASILSTGAGVALACAAARRRVPFTYLESVSRFHGPSLTGKALQYLPGIHRGTQHASWASSRWPFVGSLLEDYQPGDPIRRSASDPLRILVSLGTIAPYRFDRLVDRVLDLVTPQDFVTWQLGATTRTGLPGAVHSTMDHEQYLAEARAADAVITHSGVGSILDLLEIGVSPVVVPRRSRYNEHVDDHQEQVGRALMNYGLVTMREVNAMTRDDLRVRPTISL